MSKNRSKGDLVVSDWCKVLLVKVLCIAVLIAIAVLLDKFVFLTAKELIWLVCGVMCWSIWDSEVE